MHSRWRDGVKRQLVNPVLSGSTVVKMACVFDQLLMIDLFIV